MTVARTQIPLQIMVSVGHADTNCMTRTLAHALDFSITDDDDTTAEIYLGGLHPYRLTNRSGGSLTFTIQNADEHNGEASNPYDYDGVPCVTHVIADNESRDISPGLAGCTYLVITGSAAADNISLTAMG